MRLSFLIKKAITNVIAISVSISLFSKIAANPVSSASLSLTSVFGMGTGVPSTLSMLTCFYYIISTYILSTVFLN